MNRLRLVFFILILLVVLICGFFLGGLFFPKLTDRTNNQSAEPFFDNQMASTTGKISKIDGDKITIENFSGQIREFKMAMGSIMVYDPIVLVNQNSKPAEGSPSGAPYRKPMLGETVTVTFQTINKEFQVIGLANLPRGFTSPNPAATPDASYEQYLKERAKYTPPNGAKNVSKQLPLDLAPLSATQSAKKQ